MAIDYATTPEGHPAATRIAGPGGLLFLSGVAPRAGESGVPSAAARQAELVCDELDRMLAASSIGWTSVAKVLLYLTDIRDEAEVRGAIAARYGVEWRPAFTTVQVDNLVHPGTRVQLDVIAASA